MSYWASILAVVATLCIPFDSANAQSETTYLGEFCLAASPYGTVVPPGPFLRVGVLSYGNGHFVLTGNRENNFVPIPVYGTAMISGDKIVASLSASLGDLNVDLTSATFTMIHIVIDKTSFGGVAAELSTFITGQTPPTETTVGYWAIYPGGGPCP